MIIEIKTIYKCEFCKKKYFRKYACISHEDFCFHNPVNDRPCFHCRHLCKMEKTIYFDNPDGSESESKYSFLYCEAKREFIHSPQTELKGNAYDLGDDSNYPMPKQCNIFDNEGNNNSIF